VVLCAITYTAQNGYTPLEAAIVAEATDIVRHLLNLNMENSPKLDLNKLVNLYDFQFVSPLHNLNTTSAQNCFFHMRIDDSDLYNLVSKELERVLASRIDEEILKQVYSVKACSF
jgi:hypothetical protein